MKSRAIKTFWCGIITRSKVVKWPHSKCLTTKKIFFSRIFIYPRFFRRGWKESTEKIKELWKIFINFSSHFHSSTYTPCPFFRIARTNASAERWARWRGKSAVWQTEQSTHCVVNLFQFIATFSTHISYPPACLCRRQRSLILILGALNGASRERERGKRMKTRLRV